MHEHGHNLGVSPTLTMLDHSLFSIGSNGLCVSLIFVAQLPHSGGLDGLAYTDHVRSHLQQLVSMFDKKYVLTSNTDLFDG
jgi:hypothetical protein